MTGKAKKQAKKTQIVANWDNFKLDTVADVRLFLAFTLRHMMKGKTKIPKAKAAADLARSILKTHEIQSAPDSTDATAIAGEFSKVVSGAGSGTVAYDYPKLQVGKDSIQDGPRREEELQNGVGEETPRE